MSNVYDMSGKKKVVMSEKEEDTCNYESIGCIKCWTNAIKKVKKED